MTQTPHQSTTGPVPSASPPPFAAATQQRAAATPLGNDHNPEAELAYRFVTETDRHVFLTGRAGTGKTTLLHRLRRELKKSYVVVAPTGVAAINAQGATIHSQLQLPFGLITKKRLDSPEGQRRLSKAKVNVLRRIDLLIIDEVSMVRADVMDAIDHKLRRVRGNTRPFGGVQLLLIGDLHQLPPVVRGDEERELRQLYNTPYFFSANALQHAGLVTIELKRVYRQTDAQFVQLLGEVRANRMTDDVLAQLNTRYRSESAADTLEGYITLTSHRNAAEAINQTRLANMAGSPRTFKAHVTGNFPESSYPTEEVLQLKVGAQVMFVKNDPEGFFHNGKIGVVSKLDGDIVTVDCGTDGGEISVGRVRWENTKYSLNASTKEVSTESAGAFTQIPLRLAWAITIHKSQGLTFDRVVIDAAAAFAHGQVYVALSRCRSFEGIVLRSRIGNGAVRTDRQVSSYTEAQQDAAPDESQLAAARVAYRGQLLRDAFDFAALARSTKAFCRHGLVETRKYPGLQDSELDLIANTVNDQLLGVARSFGPQLHESLSTVDLNLDPVPVPQRCREAARYFSGKLKHVSSDLLDTLDLDTDNSEVHERGLELVTDLRRELAVLTASVALLDADQFDPEGYVTTRAKLSLGDTAAARASRATKKAPIKVVNPLLYAMLSDWRGPQAEAEGVSVSQVISSRSMRAICADLPRTGPALLAVDGIGPMRAKAYGQAILEIVDTYIDSGLAATAAAASVNGGSPSSSGSDSTDAADSPAVRVSATVSLSNSMFQQGQTLEEIVDARGYKASTILGHLATGIEAGLIDGDGLVPASDYARIADFLDGSKGELANAFKALGGRYDHGILKVARALWRRAQEAAK